MLRSERGFCTAVVDWAAVRLTSRCSVATGAAAQQAGLLRCGRGCSTANGAAGWQSDAPLARLFFDELNHSITPGGHRVAVYLDTCIGYALNTDRDEDMARGLLNSVLYITALCLTYSQRYSCHHTVPSHSLLNCNLC